MKKKYRIVRDQAAGFEVQFKYWWWPFWLQAGHFSRSAGMNTHPSVEKAIAFVEKHRDNYVVWEG